MKMIKTKWWNDKQYKTKENDRLLDLLGNRSVRVIYADGSPQSTALSQIKWIKKIGNTWYVGRIKRHGGERGTEVEPAKLENQELGLLLLEIFASRDTLILRDAA